jgi:hypothetical protein
MTSRSQYATALEGRGLSSADATTLADAASRLVDAKSGAPLLEGLAARLPEADWAALLGVVVEAQARGPEGPRAPAWRRLYVAGCPIDNIHRTLWHAFQDPDADIQDWAWLPIDAAMVNIERYVELELPRVGSMRFGVGLGCETLLSNATAGFRELVRLGASLIFLGQTINLCRNVLSPALRARVDASAGLRAPVMETIDKEPWQDELLDLGDVDELVLQRWLDSLAQMIETRAAVHDRSADRFVSADEPLTPRRIRPRPAPQPPAPRPAHLAGLLAGMQAQLEPWQQEVKLGSIDVLDPLEWLTGLAENLRL